MNMNKLIRHCGVFLFLSIGINLQVSGEGINFDHLDELISEEVDWLTLEQACIRQNALIARSVDIDNALMMMRMEATSPMISKFERVQKLHDTSLILWCYGHRTESYVLINQALELGSYGPVHQHKGRIEEADGNLEEAIKEYKQAVGLLKGERQFDTAFNLAMLYAEYEDNNQPFIELADQVEGEKRNRIAYILGLYGNESEAVKLYDVDKNTSQEEQLSYHLLKGKWALKKKDYALSNDHFWQAILLSEEENDVLYSLSIAVESYRLSGQLEALTEKLLGLNLQEEKSVSVLLNVLKEQKRYAEALDLLRTKLSLDTSLKKREFIEIYRRVDKDEALEQEVRGYIAESPEDIDWVEGLATFFIMKNQREKAVELWREFVERNQDVDNLMLAVKHMLKFGFEDYAISVVEKMITDKYYTQKKIVFVVDVLKDYVSEERAVSFLKKAEGDISKENGLYKNIADSYGILGFKEEELRVLQAYVDSLDEEHVREKMMLAGLYARAGEDKKALDLLLASQPYARSVNIGVINSRILGLLTKLEQSDSFMQKLESQLEKGTISATDMRLLLVFYRQSGRTRSKLEGVIASYFTEERLENDIEALRELSVLHQSLENHKEYDRIGRLLIERDKENAIRHIRGVLLNYVENLQEDVKTDELDKLLALHTAHTNDSVDRVFEVGILSMVLRNEEAITLARQIIAENPSYIDGYLTLAKELRDADRETEAVTALQALADVAEDAGVFMTAVDGFLDVGGGDRALMDWAKRSLIKRLVKEINTPKWHRYLAELLGQMRQTDEQLIALDYSLALDSELRFFTLKSLMRSTDPYSDVTGTQAAYMRPDKKDYVKYMRRLMGIGGQLHSKMYMNAGRSLIDMGHIEEAVAIFDLAAEKGDVKQLVDAAKIFLDVGEGARGMALLKRVKQIQKNSEDNIDIELSYAKALIQNGDYKTAYQTYKSALFGLIENQSDYVRTLDIVSYNNEQINKDRLDAQIVQIHISEPGALEADRTRDSNYKTHYQSLLQGVLYTIDQKKEVALLNEFDSMLNQLLKEANTKSHKKVLMHHPKINSVQHIYRYLCFVFKDYDRIDAINEKLLTAFNEDNNLPLIVLGYWDKWGVIAWPERIQNHSEDNRKKLSAAFTKAIGGKGNYDKTVGSRNWNAFVPSSRNSHTQFNQNHESQAFEKSFALDMPEQDLLERLKKEVDKLVELKSDNTRVRSLGSQFWFIELANILLSESHKKELALYIIESKDKKQELINALLRRLSSSTTGYSSYAAYIEKFSGESLITSQQLLEKIEASYKNSNDPAAAFYVNQYDSQYVISKLTAKDRARWIELAKEYQKTIGRDLIKVLLTQELTAAEKAFLLREFKTVIDNDDLGRIITGVLPGYVQASVKENLDLIDNMVDYARIKRPNFFRSAWFKPALYLKQDKVQESINAYVELLNNGKFFTRRSDQGLTSGFARNHFNSLYQHAFDTGVYSRSKVFKALLAYPANDAQSKEKKKAVIFNWIGLNRSVLNIDTLRALVKTYPENIQGQMLLSAAYLNQGNNVLALNTLLPLIDTVKENSEDYRNLMNSLRRVVSAIEQPVLAKKIEEKIPENNSRRASTQTSLVRNNESKPQSSLVQAIEKKDRQAIKEQLRKAVSNQLELVKKMNNFNRRVSSFELLNTRIEASETSSVTSLGNALINMKLGEDLFKDWYNKMDIHFIERRNRNRNSTQKRIVDFLTQYYQFNHDAGVGQIEALSQSIIDKKANRKDVVLWTALVQSFFKQSMDINNDYQSIINDLRPSLNKAMKQLFGQPWIYPEDIINLSKVAEHLNYINEAYAWYELLLNDRQTSRQVKLSEIQHPELSMKVASSQLIDRLVTFSRNPRQSFQVTEFISEALGIDSFNKNYSKVIENWHIYLINQKELQGRDKGYLANNIHSKKVWRLFLDKLFPHSADINSIALNRIGVLEYRALLQNRSMFNETMGYIFNRLKSRTINRSRGVNLLLSGLNQEFSKQITQYDEMVTYLYELLKKPDVIDSSLKSQLIAFAEKNNKKVELSVYKGLLNDGAFAKTRQQAAKRILSPDEKLIRDIVGVEDFQYLVSNVRVLQQLVDYHKIVGEQLTLTRAKRAIQSIKTSRGRRFPSPSLVSFEAIPSLMQRLLKEDKIDVVFELARTVSTYYITPTFVDLMEKVALENNQSTELKYWRDIKQSLNSLSSSDNEDDKEVVKTSQVINY